MSIMGNVTQVYGNDGHSVTGRRKEKKKLPLLYNDASLFQIRPQQSGP